MERGLATELLSSEVLSNTEVDTWVDFFKQVLESDRLKETMRKSVATHLSLIPVITFVDPDQSSHEMHVEISLDHYSRLGLRFLETGKYAVPIPGFHNFDISWDKIENSDWKEYVCYGEKPRIGDLDDRKIASLLIRVGANIPSEDQIIDHWEKVSFTKLR